MTNSVPPESAPRFQFESGSIGQGGFGHVYKGRDNVLERDIAVKVLNPILRDFPGDRDRFHREAKILARLCHPNIPAIYDVALTANEFLLIFQFIEGITLRSIMDAEGPIPLQTAKVWFAQLASALDHAHSIQIVHRDIKPENIIVTPNRESAYLVDFGIALMAGDASRLTKEGYVIGTPGYMSPEQEAGSEIDARTDVYSLGITLYEALAGKRPPAGTYDELTVINETNPPELDDLIQDCLQPVEARIPTAKLFGQRLVALTGPTRPLSEVLMHGRLHELASSLRDLTPEGFSKLPLGQRSLVFLKVDDLVESSTTDQRFQQAAEEFLELLVHLSLLVPNDEYKKVVVAAVRWAFVTQPERYRSRDIRRAMVNAATHAREDAHKIIGTAFGDAVEELNFAKVQEWLLHAIREVVQALLANPHCADATPRLVTLLREVNRAQRSRQESGGELL